MGAGIAWEQVLLESKHCLGAGAAWVGAGTAWAGAGQLRAACRANRCSAPVCCVVLGMRNVCCGCYGLCAMLWLFVYFCGGFHRFACPVATPGAFILTVALWIFGGSIGVNAVCAAIVGLTILLVTNVVTWKVRELGCERIVTSQV